MNRQFAINFSAKTFSETVARHATFSPGVGVPITFSKPSSALSDGLLLYDAWSPVIVDATPPETSWLSRLSIWGSKGGSEYVKLFDANDNYTDGFLTASAAFAALSALFPLTFDEYDLYQVLTYQDGGIGVGGSDDNRGGISLLVDIEDGKYFNDLVPDMPDAPIKEQWQWMTDTQVSYNGTEDRTPLNVTARRTFTGTLSFDDVKDVRRYQATMQKAFQGSFYVPLFQHQLKAKEPVPAFSDYVMCNTIRSDFRDEGLALIREGSVWELLVVETVYDDRIMLGTSPMNSYSARALISPVTKVFTTTGQTLKRVNPDHSALADFNFQELEPWLPFVNPQEDESLTTFDMMFVLDNRNIGSQFDTQFDSGILITDSYIGRPDIMNPWTQGQWGFPLRWQCNRVFDVHSWLWWQKFCHAIQGSNLPFLLPSFRSDLEVVTPAVAGGNAIVFEGHEFRDHYYGLDTFARLVIESAGQRQFVKVTGISNVSGNDRVTFTPALAAGDWSVDQTAGFLLKVRNADDKVSCDHYGLHTDIMMGVRTVA